MIAFYSTPTGLKLLTKMPHTMAEAMQAMRPVTQKHTEEMKPRLDHQVAELKKEYKDGQGKTTQAPGSN